MEEGDEKVDSLFPLFAVPSDAQQSLAPINNAPDAEWLSNSSFTTDLSVVNVALASLYKDESPTAAAVASPSSPHQVKPEPTSYEILEGEKEGKHLSDSDNDVFGSDSDDRGRKKRRKKKRTEKHRRKRKRSGDVEEHDAAGGFTSRKSIVRAWADSDVKPPKDYYFDAHGDRDNLVYGSLYRMDIPRYRPFNSENQSAFDFRGLFGLTQRVFALDKDGDIDALDPKLRSAGRYWSPKYAAVERHRNLKRLRLAVPKRSRGLISEDFIPLYDVEVPSVLEESWEDEVLRKTREFNKLTRENPLNEKAWLDFAAFQDRVISMQAHKGARLQMLEKKISILEKATELITDSEELLLSLMKAYKSRDNRDELIGRWERVLARHSGSHKLWKEFLRVVRGEFSRFKVSDVRKMYAHAIQALSAACRKQFRQASQSEKSSIHEPVIDDLELGLVDIFLSLCRFEWQAGYQELATALFQAEIEFSLFCPSLFLSENSKQRLFEHFWNSNGPRIGEEGAMGWCTWLEKEEENRQKIMKAEASCDDDRGGWTGWSEQPSRSKDMDKELKNIVDNDLTSGHFQEEVDSEEDIKQEDDVETLLKQLGIDVDVEEGTEVRDTLTWNKWCQEELLRDANQWMPIRKKPDASISETDKRHEGEDNEQFTRVILFEDVSEYMFSLSSREARLSLLSEFVEFFNGQITQRICTNSSSWTEKILSLEVLPDCILQNLRSVGDLANPQSSSTGNSLEFCLGSTIDSHRRLDVMKFVRNAILLCLTVFPRNPMLQEAAFAAEELSVTGTYSHTASRALAKSLLKCDRQDVLLCGVYARREAAFGNIDLARRVFDMALSSVEELSLDIQTNAPLLCFWYAEAECANSSGDAHESSSRALHILSCLGNGAKYVQFEHKPSNLQLLRAHQGFKERMKTIQSAWGHGMIDDQSIALACSAALFEELTAGCTASVEVLEDVFAMALPERRIKSGQLEFLFNYYVKMLLRNHEKLSGSRIWKSISQGLQMYPSSSELLKALVDISYLYTTPNKVRLIFDDYCHRNPSVTLWLAALSFEMSRGGSQHRIQALFERALTNETLNKSVIIWRMYIAYGTDVVRNPSTAKRIFFRAVHACPWSKKLWLDGFSKLNSLLTAKELSDLQEVMRDKELNLRTDIYEILLKDELVS